MLCVMMHNERIALPDTGQLSAGQTADIASELLAVPAAVEWPNPRSAVKRKMTITASGGRDIVNAEQILRMEIRIGYNQARSKPGHM